MGIVLNCCGRVWGGGPFQRESGIVVDVFVSLAQSDLDAVYGAGVRLVLWNGNV